MTRSGRYLKDIVYGANDGIITTFAIVAGVAGAGIADPKTTIMFLGVANVFADGFSMAASDYLGSKSERDYVASELKDEEREVLEDSKQERKEMEDMLKEQGYEDGDARTLTELMFKKKKFFVDLMMYEAHNVSTHGNGSPIKSALATFLAFVCAGLLPVAPFFILPASAEFFMYSIIATTGALFVVGALRSLFTKKSFVFSGVEMLVVGGVAALIAYGVGMALAGATAAL